MKSPTVSSSVSVVIPVKCIDEFTLDSIRSVVDQSENVLEVIIVCDYRLCSEVDRLVVMAGFCKKANIKIVNPKIRGISAALNAGINNSSGDYIVRMDSDDLSLPNRIETQRRILDANKSINVLGSNAELIDKNGLTIKEKMMSYPTGLTCLKSRTIVKNPIIHPTVMMRRECLEDVGGYTPIFSEDFDLWIRIIDKFPESIYVTDDVLLKYRRHENQLSTQAYWNSQLAVLAVMFKSAITRPTSIKIFSFWLIAIKLVAIKIKGVK